LEVRAIALPHYDLCGYGTEMVCRGSKATIGRETVQVLSAIEQTCSAGPRFFW